MLKRWLFVGIVVPAVAAVALSVLLGCGSGGEVWQPNKPRVLTSIVPLHCFTALIAGDDADVRCLLTTKGPHDFQPSAQDARLLSGAQLLISDGLGLEDFLDGLLHNAGNRKLKVVKAGERIPAELLKKADGTPHYHGD